MTHNTFGRYQIIRPLGAGGMAGVYLAHDPNLDRQVALKIPSQERMSAEMLARFHIEARAVARLEHSAIVPLYEYGDQDGRPFLIMRYMPGGSLDDRVAQRPASLSEAAAIIDRIAAALDYAHARGVIHRDVKPGNILFDGAGAAYLSDFGIARMAKSAGEKTLTQTGLIIGTAAYMSPEQAMGKPGLDGRSDIYSLGVVLYEMLVGELPYQADSALQQALQNVNAPIPQIRARRPDLSPAVQSVIDRALAKDPAHRYQTGRALAADLRHLASGRQPARAASPFPPWLIAVIVVGVLALFAAFALRGRNGSPTINNDATSPVITDVEQSGEAIEPVANDGATAGDSLSAAVAGAEETPPDDPSAGSTDTTGPPSSGLGGAGEIYAPPIPANDSFEPGGGAPPDDVQTQVPYSIYYGDMYEDDSSDRAWIDSLSPARLEPMPFQGPEFMIDLLAYTCGWPAAGNYPATIEHPDGRTEPDSFHQVDQPELCNLYLQTVSPPVLGTYTVQFDAFDHMRHSIDVVAPDGPRFYVQHVGNQGSTFLYLHNFRPNEAVRVYEYRQDFDTLRLVGWQAYRVDINGQLYLHTGYCISNICQNDPNYHESFFIVIGDDSGEVREFNQIPTEVRPLQSILAGGSTVAGPTGEAGDIRVVDRGGVAIEQVFVPAGTFRMGTDGGGDDERPVHDVTVDAFWIDRTEVTNAQFEAYVGATGLQTTAERTGRGSVYSDDSWQPQPGTNWRRPQGPDSVAEPDHPVVLVTWEEAAGFCSWAGGRLPTEAEWEYAARGPESLPFPWGFERDTSLFNSCDSNCPYEWRAMEADDGYRYTAPVGSYPGGASWVGALDMVGNVWEWVNDWADENAYTVGPRTNPTGPDSGALRSIRGAAWVHEPGIHYAANRGRGFPTVAYNGFGFRCAAVDGPSSTSVTSLPTSLPTAIATATASPSPTPAACQFAVGDRWRTGLWSAHQSRLGCATNAPRQPSSAFQYYRNGTMIWRGDRELVYVIYNNGRFASYNALAGPSGYHHSDLLKGAFGYLWNNNATVRDSLGEPITTENNAAEFTVQDFAGGTILYFNDNGAQTIALFGDDNTWSSP